MPVLRSEFKTYRLYYQPAPQYWWTSRLYLYNNGQLVGSIFFVKDGVSIPENSDTYGYPRIHFKEDKFEEIMNILWHESPLYITLNTSNGIGTISTSMEPIGEEEGEEEDI